MLSADDRGVGYLLPEGSTTVGAGPKCDLRLDGPGLKPLHCVIVQSAEGLTVRRWSPGTKLNGASFTESALRMGDCLSIGPIELHVSPVDESQVDKSQVDKSPVDKSPVDKSPVDKSPVDKSPVDEPDTLADEGQAAPAEVAEGNQDFDGGWEQSDDEPSDTACDVLDHKEEPAPFGFDRSAHEGDLAEPPLDNAAAQPVHGPEGWQVAETDPGESADLTEPAGEQADSVDEQAASPFAGVFPVPPHLLKPWNDASSAADTTPTVPSGADAETASEDVWSVVAEGLEEPSATLDEPPCEEHAGETTADEEPVAEEPVAEEPVAEEPVDEEPVDEEPVDEEPVDEEPVDEEPADEEPVDEAAIAGQAEPAADPLAGSDDLVAVAVEDREEQLGAAVEPEAEDAPRDQCGLAASRPKEVQEVCDEAVNACESPQPELCAADGEVEFYTDVNWQAVDTAATSEGVRATAAPESKPAPHPVNLAVMLHARDQIQAVRNRAKRIVQGLRSERAASQTTRDELETSKARSAELAACVEELKASLAERDALYSGLEAEKQSQDEELDRLRTAVGDQESINQELRDQLATQGAQIAELTAAIQGWESERKTLTDELAAAQQQLELRPAAAELSTSEQEADHPSDAAGEDWSVDLATTESEAPVSDAADWDASTAVEAEAVEPEAVEPEAGETEAGPEPSSLWASALQDDSAEESPSATAEPESTAATVPGESMWSTNLDEQAPREEACETVEQVCIEGEEPDAVAWSVSSLAADATSDAEPAAAYDEAPCSPATDLWDIERASDAPQTPDEADEPTPPVDEGDSPADAWEAPLAGDSAPAEEEPLWGETNASPAVDEQPSVEAFAAEAPTPLPAPEASPWGAAPAASEQTGDDQPAADWEPPVDVDTEPVASVESPVKGDSCDEPELGEHAERGPLTEYINEGEAPIPAAKSGPTPVPDWLLGDDGESDDDLTDDAEAAGSDEQPEPQGPPEQVSFYEKYAHLLPEDDEQPVEPEAEPMAPAPTPVAVAEELSSSGSGDEEEDIDAYMVRLMERMRGGDPSPATAPAKAKSGPSTQQPTRVAGAAPEPAPEQPAPSLINLEDIKRREKPEAATDMASLRRLANDSARQAIGVAASKQSREQSVANLVIAGIAFVSGGYLITSAPSVFSTQLIGGAFALLLSGVWVFRSLSHLLRSVRDGAYDGAVREVVSRDKLPINK
ncbi:hypothetical protein Pla123a_41030 [Posidoniimonas polymericola]|uniref:YscD cytoplasmic domain-containing protein n=1 Tax=Posidoniimonas polymericola TaxID=2528002 RepID=A0A5C5YCH9_9BACT|nr:FHA domain-containing protein [Posidoniimonas polymericola]TWT72804.1 hypothetical protein Pla123a_41030 [Posidoniimonas polymericola]